MSPMSSTLPTHPLSVIPLPPSVLSSSALQSPKSSSSLLNSSCSMGLPAEISFFVPPSESPVLLSPPSPSLPCPVIAENNVSTVNGKEEIFFRPPPTQSMEALAIISLYQLASCPVDSSCPGQSQIVSPFSSDALVSSHDIQVIKKDAVQESHTTSPADSTTSKRKFENTYYYPPRSTTLAKKSRSVECSMPELCNQGNVAYTIPSGTKRSCLEVDLSQRPVKGKRKRASPEQLAVLHQVLAQTAFPTTDLREKLALDLAMTPRAIQIWFQNQRQNAAAKGKAYPLTKATSPQITQAEMFNGVGVLAHPMSPPLSPLNMTPVVESVSTFVRPRQMEIGSLLNHDDECSPTVSAVPTRALTIPTALSRSPIPFFQNPARLSPSQQWAAYLGCQSMPLIPPRMSHH